MGDASGAFVSRGVHGGGGGGHARRVGDGGKEQGRLRLRTGPYGRGGEGEWMRVEPE